MRLIGNKIIVIAGIMVTLGVSACKKWVEDAPQPLAVDESSIFSTENGFRETLNGVYIQMGDESLYGKELTIGILSLAGRNYDSVSMAKSGTLYYNAATLNLTHPSVKSHSAQIWNKMYSAVGNLNNLIENLEKRKSVLSERRYQDFKGEALAIRAYLHFDLLRMFSTNQLQDNGIPYVLTVDFNATASKTVGETLDRCITDLVEAEGLLDGQTLETSWFNKWAVKGLLARIYLYKGDLLNASKYALEVINSEQIVLSSGTPADLLFTKESLFKLYIYANNYYNSYRELFGAPRLLGLSVASQNALYVPTTDYRRNFIDVTTGNILGVPILPRKLTVTASNIFPMLKLPEMYYIAAECAPEVNEGLSYINLVRASRNLPALTVANVPDMNALSAEIRNEYRKEFIAEGQMFFYYKRKHTPFNSLPFYSPTPIVGSVPVADNATYVFVRPE